MVQILIFMVQAHLIRDIYRVIAHCRSRETGVADHPGIHLVESP
jgi:hypothetical protein